MDIMLPGISGIELCRQIRKASEVPIIFISAKGSEADRVIGLEIGADDYLVKPFGMRELVARCRALLRRSHAQAAAAEAAADRKRRIGGLLRWTIEQLGRRRLRQVLSHS